MLEHMIAENALGIIREHNDFGFCYRSPSRLDDGLLSLPRKPPWRFTVNSEELLLAAPRLKALVFRGLMTVPPFTDDPQSARPYFGKFRELRDAIAARKLPSVAMDELSMGMSHDFEVAIEEGSTCVRVGTAIFGERIKA